MNTTQKLKIQGTGRDLGLYEKELPKCLGIETLRMVKENSQFQVWRDFSGGCASPIDYLVHPSTQQAWEGHPDRIEAIFRFSNTEFVRSVRFASSDDYGCREKWARKTVRVWKMYANDDKVVYYRFGRSPEIFEIESGVRG